MAWGTKDSAKYAEIPAGTVFSYAKFGDNTFIDLENLKTVGQLGSSRNYIDCTTLIDTTTKTINGIKELLDVSWTFIDAAKEKDFQDFLDLADADEHITVKVVFPNGREFTGEYYLSGYAMDEPDSSTPTSFTVNARQITASWKNPNIT